MSQIPKSPWRRGRLASSTSTPSETLTAIAWDSRDQSLTLAKLAANPNMSWVQLGRLANECSEPSRRAMGRAMSTFRAYKLLSERNAQDFANSLAKSEGVAPPEEDCLRGLVDLFAHSHHYQLRAQAARNPLVPTRSLELLANDKELEVRLAVAGNPCTPWSALNVVISADGLESRQGSNGQSSRASAEDWDFLKSKVAGNESAAPNTLWRLAREGFESSVASNPAAPPDLLVTLSEGFITPRPANEDRSVTAVWLSELLKSVAANAQTPAPTLHAMVEEGFTEGIARNPNAPGVLLDLVARRDKWNGAVVRSVATHRHATRETLEWIFHHAPDGDARDMSHRRLRALTLPDDADDD